jgi:hypothetical protein
MTNDNMRNGKICIQGEWIEPSGEELDYMFLSHCRQLEFVRYGIDNKWQVFGFEKKYEYNVVWGWISDADKKAFFDKVQNMYNMDYVPKNPNHVYFQTNHMYASYDGWHRQWPSGC